jgi:citronellyl-CoA dehydrogenase
MATGAMRLALDRTIEYVRSRQAFGHALADNQWIQFKLAELVAEVDLLRQYNYACADVIVRGDDPIVVTKMASIAKLKSGRLQREIADWSMQFHGGIGYMEETWTARYYRDSRLLSIGGGADEVMLRIIAQLEGIGKS